jgi:GT2 family glycosyltransferase
VVASASVGIVTFQSVSHIGRCLEAVRAQTRAPAEVVVWDNASADGSRDLARSHGVRVLASPTNVGFAAAANELVRVTTAPYLLLLNPDATPAPDYIERVVAAAEADPRIGSVTGKLVRPMTAGGEVVLDSAGHVLFRNRHAANRGENEPDRGQYDRPAEVFGVCAAAALYRRAMLEDVRLGTQYFADTFFAYLEDVDLDWRARLRGWKAWYEPAAVCIHARGHRGKRRLSHPWVLRHSLKNRYLLMVRNDRVGDVLRDLPGIAALELLRFVDYAFTRPSALRGYLDAARLLPQALAARRLIQSGRRTSPPELRAWMAAPVWRRRAAS